MASVPLAFKDKITPDVIKEKLLARYAKSNLEIKQEDLEIEIKFITDKITSEKNPTSDLLDDVINSLILSKEQALEIAKSLVEKDD